MKETMVANFNVSDDLCKVSTNESQRLTFMQKYLVHLQSQYCFIPPVTSLMLVTYIIMQYYLHNNKSVNLRFIYT